MRLRARGWGLAVGIEAVDAELCFGDDATGGVQLAAVGQRLYHLRIRKEIGVGGVLEALGQASAARVDAQVRPLGGYSRDRGMEKS